MANTAADVLIQAIQDWGVDVVFGLPGDGINGIMEALRKRQEQIRFIQARHEEAAAFMACAYAKYTGQLGVCLATSGPGGIHLLNGLYDAKLDGQPVLAITGHHYHDLIDTHAQQDVDLDRVFLEPWRFPARSSSKRSSIHSCRRCRQRSVSIKQRNLPSLSRAANRIERRLPGQFCRKSARADLKGGEPMNMCLD